MTDSADFPIYRGHMQYRCLGCGAVYGIDQLHYTCPECRSVLLLEDTTFDHLLDHAPEEWRATFDQRAASKDPALRGVFRFYELMAPVLEPGDIVYLGEGQTPVIRANKRLQGHIGQPLAFKNDGQNPSASFKDRGMACAFSYLKSLVRRKGWDQVLTVCASTGDTSAAAALYAAYVGDPITSVVILPQGKVTPQQLAQPLGSGATVIEVPGVFDDCMKVVEFLADNYRVALLNSKNAWRILGQESYAFETAQWFDWDMSGKAVFVPIGNAGNITAIMSGFLKLRRLGAIRELPRVVGVQSAHADPVYRYYSQEEGRRRYQSVTVTPSVAQAAMIGDPVSFPRVRHLVGQYEEMGGSVAVVQVEEQAIIESMLLANRHGHISCTQGGECLAGLTRAMELDLLDKDELAILDATAHMLKFIGFQEMYFQDTFPPEYDIRPREQLINRPEPVLTQEDLTSLSRREFAEKAGRVIVEKLGLVKK